ncbi:uncharacterized protein LOC111019907 [Momordica charantia]|uniref:Uncharacterized protein LOC111019907 n=1 Tax=Momordica charantia TaxID=3673 RepID=A0A6J1DFB4_MOMCH|nr:uncharacterized protein LOC111019907 [Momordica charantia]
MKSPANLKELQSLNGKIAALNKFVSKSTDKCLPFFKTLRKMANLSGRTSPALQNANADALACLASSYEMNLPRTLMVEILHGLSLAEPEVMDIDLSRTADWMTLIIKHLEIRELPEDRVEALRFRRWAAHYLLKDRVLFKIWYSLQLLQCIGVAETGYMISEVHEGNCGDHLVG